MPAGRGQQHGQDEPRAQHKSNPISIMSARPAEFNDDTAVLDELGFVVPRNLVSKYRSLKARDAASTAAKHNWPELLAQAAKKQYRAGGPLPPKFVAAVSDGIPAAHRAE